MFIWQIKQVVRIVVLLIWSVLGFLLWIPLLVRMTFYFTFMVMASTFARADMKGHKSVSIGLFPFTYMDSEP